MAGLDEELRAELLRRTEKDQIARKALDTDAMLAADGENLPWLRGVIASRGWPGASLVGTDGAFAAWLLAQHMDADPAFQRECLDLMTAAVEAGEATVRELAYLTDRVLLAEGQPQVYGTQVTREDGQVLPRDVRDPDRLDERRAAVGLGPFAEYARLFDDPREFQRRLKCPGCAAWVPFDESEAGQPVTVTCSGCGRETTFRTKRRG
jgi:hypothetical protein